MGIVVKCRCGEVVDYNNWKSHIRRKGEKGKHKTIKIINNNTGEEVETHKEASELGWISKKDKGGRNKEKVEQEYKDYAETITGKILETDVKIHPYVYQNFVNVMGMMPKKYPTDNEEVFNKYLLDIAIFFRLVTDSILPWGDEVAEAIMKQYNQ